MGLRSVTRLAVAAALFALLVCPQPSAAQDDSGFRPLVIPPALVTRTAPPPALASSKALLAHKLMASPAFWTTFLAMVLAGLALGANTGAPCLVIGHRRSRRRVRFDDHKQRWVSDCKRCGVELFRDAQAGWSRDTDAASPVRTPARALARRADAPGPASTANERRIVIHPIPPAPPVNPVPAPESARDHAPILTPQPNRQERGIIVEHIPSANGAIRPPIQPMRRDDRVDAIVDELLDNMLIGNVTPPGARGALFFALDEFRARGEMKQTRCAERISIAMQQLECALRRGSEADAKAARRSMKAVAGEWLSFRRPDHSSARRPVIETQFRPSAVEHVQA